MTTKKKSTKKPASKRRETKPAQEPYTVVDVNREVREVEVDLPTKCPDCGSTERSEYNNLATTPGPVRVGRMMCEKVERRRTSCLKCGRRRIDRKLYPLRPAEGS